jgi:hypothetical protein
MWTAWIFHFLKSLFDVIADLHDEYATGRLRF